MSPVATINLTPPNLDWAGLAPMLILFGAASIGVLVEAFVPRRQRHGVQLVLSRNGQVSGANVRLTKEITLRPGSVYAIIRGFARHWRASASLK